MTAISNRTRKLRTFVLTGAGVILVTAAAASFGDRNRTDGGQINVPTPHPIFTSNELLAEAKPDECFNGVGVDYPPINPDGTCNVGQPKTNESYIWGLTEESGKLYFGTIANAACMVSGQGVLTADSIQASREFICEYGESQYARRIPALPDSIGDWRPPSIYKYDLATSQLTRIDGFADPLLARTLGFRGAGSINNIAFLGGSYIFGNGINLFAFKADTGEYLGSCQMTNYNYIRKWDLVDGVLYVGVGNATGGQVLRWNGNDQSFQGNFCNDFADVGHLSAYTANVTLYTGADGQDRLAATTAPVKNGFGVGLWISPPLGPDGLQPEDADGWVMVWEPADYDPDRIVAQYGYSGGAVQSYGGWLYWGTIHLPAVGAKKVHMSCTYSFCFGVPANPDEEQALSKGVYRTASVWRGRNLEDAGTREIQLLYGETELPACTAPHTFTMTSTGWTPLYGKSGFNNPKNEYIWQMAVFDNRLFVGTFDSSYGTPETGGDLWRFDSPDSRALNENYQGLGDTNNYGVRALEGLDDGTGLIVGMANPSNLAVGGGWELRRLKKTP